ncbi:hypothetical protein PGTUg99_023532 [Puccinia graminis f. sp. tritici]|uniref:Uncharacterized protein n=1 Tax=Puccinia graminis f. sp. tritici TaxID=56615 RepID=A0A5B0LUT9_PUCGR|nr:hypothetical protein PGTUg99_023532 [Puccinia graminis f. sp. tritici]
MPEQTSPVLCPETQGADAPALQHPPRKTSVLLECLFFIPDVHPTISPRKGAAPPSVKQWTKITAKPPLMPWVTDIQSMTWEQFQTEAFKFLGSQCSDLIPAFEAVNKDKKIAWYASISGHPKYDSEKKFIILGPIGYLDFVTAAYSARAAKILFKLIMKDPREDEDGTCNSWTLETSPHPVTPKAKALVHHPKRKSARASTGGRPPAYIEVSSTEEATPTAQARNAGSKSRRLNEGIAATNSKNAPGSRSDAAINTQPAHADVINNQLETSNNTTSDEDRRALPTTPPTQMVRSPLGAARADMETLSMEMFLNVAGIPHEDEVTRARMRVHGITHWTFFQASNEQDLVALGFPIGVARLLCEGVPRLEAHADEVIADRHRDEILAGFNNF